MGGCFSDNKKERPENRTVRRKEENRTVIGDDIGIKINYDSKGPVRYS